MLPCLGGMLLGVILSGAAAGAHPLEHRAAAVSLVVGLAAWGVWAGWAVRRWRHSPVGQLAWRDGQWWWCPQGRAEACSLTGVDLAWDGQGVLLVRLQGAAAPGRWLWLERRRDAARWDDLRRAVWAARRPASRVAATPT